MDKAWGSLRKVAGASQSAPASGNKEKKPHKKKRSSSDPLHMPVVVEPVDRKRKKREDILIPPGEDVHVWLQEDEQHL
jgi:hypothetical protein